MHTCFSRPVSVSVYCAGLLHEPSEVYPVAGDIQWCTATMFTSTWLSIHTTHRLTVDIIVQIWPQIISIDYNYNPGDGTGFPLSVEHFFQSMQKEVTDGADVLLHRLTTGQCTAWFCVTWFWENQYEHTIGWKVSPPPFLQAQMRSILKHIFFYYHGGNVFDRLPHSLCVSEFYIFHECRISTSMTK